MRTYGDSLLTTLETAASGIPYVRVYIVLGTPVTYDTTNRVLAVTQFESAYVDGCEILLDNQDGALTDVVMKGAEINLGFGFE